MFFFINKFSNSWLAFRKKWIQNTQNYTSPKNKTLSVTNRPKTKRSNNKTSKITKSPNLQNVQSYKMSKISKVTKCPKLQNVQNSKMSKITKFPIFQNVQN